MNQTTADKIEAILDSHMWDKYPRWREIGPSDLPVIAQEIAKALVSEPETDNEIAKRVIEEYIENGLKEKYRKGAGHGWEKGISYKHEVSLLQDCYDWLDQ